MEKESAEDRDESQVYGYIPALSSEKYHLPEIRKAPDKYSDINHASDK